MLANASPFAVFTDAPPPIVLTDTCPFAFFTDAPQPIVLTDTSPFAFFTFGPPPLVVAILMGRAVLAVCFFLIVWTCWMPLFEYFIDDYMVSNTNFIRIQRGHVLVF